VAAIETRFMQDEIESAAYSFAKAVDSGEKIVVGVNRFTDADSERAEVFPIDITTAANPDRSDKVGSRLARPSGVDTALSDIAVTARGEGNLLLPMKAALAVMSTLGEVADVLRGEFGVYQPGG